MQYIRIQNIIFFVVDNGYTVMARWDRTLDQIRAHSFGVLTYPLPPFIPIPDISPSQVLPLRTYPGRGIVPDSTHSLTIISVDTVRQGTRCYGYTVRQGTRCYGYIVRQGARCYGYTVRQCARCYGYTVLQGARCYGYTVRQCARCYVYTVRQGARCYGYTVRQDTRCYLYTVRQGARCYGYTVRQDTRCNLYTVRQGARCYGYTVRHGARCYGYLLEVPAGGGWVEHGQFQLIVRPHDEHLKTVVTIVVFMNTYDYMESKYIDS